MQAHTGLSGHQIALRGTVQLLFWTVAWVASVALARFGPGHLWDGREALSWIAVFVNVTVGILWIGAHARYLRRIDELQRKIMQDALAVTLGVGWVGGFAYVVADAANLISYDADIGLFSVLLAVVYMLAVAFGHMRYR